MLFVELVRLFDFIHVERDAQSGFCGHVNEAAFDRQWF